MNLAERGGEFFDELPESFRQLAIGEIGAAARITCVASAAFRGTEPIKEVVVNRDVLEAVETILTYHFIMARARAIMGAPDEGSFPEFEKAGGPGEAMRAVAAHLFVMQSGEHGLPAFTIAPECESSPA